MAPLSDSQWTRRLIPPLHIFLILNLTLTIHLATAEEEPITTTPTNNTTSESNDKVPIVIHSEEDEEGDIEDDYSDPSLWGCRCWSLHCSHPIVSLPCHVECKCRGRRVRSVPANLPLNVNLL